MSDHEPIVLEVKESNLPDFNSKKLFHSWNNGRSVDSLPCWQDFDPLKIYAGLPDLMIYDFLIDKNNYYISIIGEDCSDNFHFKSKPNFIEDVIPAANLDDVLTRLDRVKSTQKPHLVVKEKTWVSSEFSAERTDQYTVLFLPYSSNKNNVELTILNYMHFKSI